MKRKCVIEKIQMLTRFENANIDLIPILLTIVYAIIAYLAEDCETNKLNLIELDNIIGCIPQWNHSIN